MKLGELLLMLIFFGMGSSLVMYAFNDYLIARTIGPSQTPITTKAGEALKIPIEHPPSSGQIAVTICHTAPSGPTCLPIAVHDIASSITVRMPIGYQPGPATLQVTNLVNGSSYSLVIIPITIQ
jgi:hypothetical protein